MVFLWFSICFSLHLMVWFNLILISLVSFARDKSLLLIFHFTCIYFPLSTFNKLQINNDVVGAYYELFLFIEQEML